MLMCVCPCSMYVCFLSNRNHPCVFLCILSCFLSLSSQVNAVSSSLSMHVLCFLRTHGLCEWRGDLLKHSLDVNVLTCSSVFFLVVSLHPNTSCWSYPGRVSASKRKASTYSLSIIPRAQNFTVHLSLETSLDSWSLPHFSSTGKDIDISISKLLKKSHLALFRSIIPPLQ